MSIGKVRLLPRVCRRSDDHWKRSPSPVAGHVFSIVDNVEQEEVDEDTVLVEVSCDEASLREAAGEWVEQDEYENRLHRQSPGKFDDSL